MAKVLDSRNQRLLHFGSLYFAQGAILSYFLTFNILYLRRHDLAADEIGVFQAVLVLPFVLKILLGMLSDRFSLMGFGYRYPYILLGLLLQVAGVMALSSVSLPANLDHFFLVALLSAIGMALYDTCTDGLAVEATPEHERGLVQGVMVGARALGILTALLLGGYLVDDWGWEPVFYMVAIMSLPALVLTVLRWGIGEGAAGEAFGWSAFRALTRSDVLLLALVGCGYALALDGVLSYLSYHEAADRLAGVGLISGLVAWSMLGRIAGAVTSARITEQIGYRRSLRSAILLSIIACLWLSLRFDTLLLAAGCFFFGFSYGYFTAVYSATAMRLCDKRIAASMFAIFMLFLNVGIGIGQALGGWITQAFGFQWLAWIMAAVVFGLLLPVRKLGK